MLDRAARSQVAHITGAAFILLIVGLNTQDSQLVRYSSWLIYGVLTVSLALIWGKGGILVFGQPAFFGVGGYAYGIMSINMISRTGETVTALLVGAFVAGLFAAILGAFLFYGRLANISIAIVTLAVSLVLYTLLQGTAGREWRVGDAFLGGYNGMTGIPPITIGVPGLEGHTLGPQQSFFFFSLVAIGAYSWCVALLRRPFGRIACAIRENEQRCELLGYDVRGRKLILFTAAGSLAGLAGGCFAAWALFINPNVFGLQQAAVLIIWLLVGGRHSLVGAFVGAASVQWFTSFLGSGAGGRDTPLILGVVLVLSVLFLPGGLAGLGYSAREALSSWRRHGAALATAPSVAGPLEVATTPTTWTRERTGSDGTGAELSDTERPLLRARNLAMSFDGLNALSDVTLELRDAEVRSIIGPNGAGKSTLFNLLVGRFQPSAGSIQFAGKDITRLPPHRRARLGIAIKQQIPSLFPGLAVEENLWLASYPVDSSDASAHARARTVLQSIGLGHRSETPAGQLGHGEQQWLEIGLALAQEARLVLLDEPAAGMTKADNQRTLSLVEQLSRRASVVVVEHDMEFIRDLGARVTMLNNGTILVEGSLDELRRDPRVIATYLGTTGA